LYSQFPSSDIELEVHGMFAEKLFFYLFFLSNPKEEGVTLNSDFTTLVEINWLIFLRSKLKMSRDKQKIACTVKKPRKI
jgi:hypothetical protein